MSEAPIIKASIETIEPPPPAPRPDLGQAVRVSIAGLVAPSTAELEERVETLERIVVLLDEALRKVEAGAATPQNEEDR